VYGAHARQLEAELAAGVGADQQLLNILDEHTPAIERTAEDGEERALRIGQAGRF
jgi:hypothetical protein